MLLVACYGRVSAGGDDATKSRLGRGRCADSQCWRLDGSAPRRVCTGGSDAFLHRRDNTGLRAGIQMQGTIRPRAWLTNGDRSGGADRWDGQLYASRQPQRGRHWHRARPPGSGTYQVNDDCTAIAVLQPGPPHNRRAHEIVERVEVDYQQSASHHGQRRAQENQSSLTPGQTRTTMSPSRTATAKRSKWLDSLPLGNQPKAVAAC